VSVADPQGIGVQSDKNAASACFWADIIVQSKNEIAKGHTWWPVQRGWPGRALTAAL